MYTPFFTKFYHLMKPFCPDERINNKYVHGYHICFIYVVIQNFKG